MLISKLFDKRFAEYQNSVTRQHLEEVQNIYKEMRGWRHDYRNHIQTMKSYLSLGHTEQLDIYLDKLAEDLTSVDKLIKSGNVTIDAVLNSKLSLAVSQKIAVTAKAVVPEKMPLNGVDVCIVIGNLLDNAVEACIKLPDEDARFIRVYIDVKRGQLYISVTNSTSGKTRKLLGKYITDKTGYHGIGLTRVDRVVSKYGGWLKRRDEENVFTTELMLPVEDENAIRAQI